jgi:prepilin signal peptidase PulO-like enzyme (type II secretory pathway)
LFIPASPAVQAALLAATIVLTVLAVVRTRTLPDAEAPSARGGLHWRWSAILHVGALALLGIPIVLLARAATLAESVQCVTLMGVLYGISAADLRTLQVPLAPLFAAMLVRIVAVGLTDRTVLQPAVLGLFTGAGVLTLVGLAYEWIRGRPGLGAGDSAVLGLIGCYVGWQGIVPVLLVGAVSGLVGGGAMLVVARRPLSTPLPFAPFLAIGGWIVFLAQWGGWFPLGAAAG